MTENLDEEASYIEKHVNIGEMSPCLPVVKEEILNYYDNEFESTPFSVQINREPLLEECESRHFQPLCSGLTNNDNSQNMLLHCNKIILGSKPNKVSSDEENLEQSAKSYQENNEVSIDENYFDELVTSYEPSVVLHDIQSYLYKSKRFCDYCTILFPEPNGYENHVQIFHSEKCSTAMSRNESLTERRQHKCTICAKLFVAPHVLRRHLMNIHKLNNANVIDNTTKDNSAEVIDDTTKETNRNRMRYENTTMEVNAAVNDITVKKTNANVIKNAAKEACATGFENIMKETKAKVIENTMKDTNTPKINHASSDLSNTCFHCKKSFDTQKSLIEHLYDILQMKRKNTEIVPVLKSVLFKCNKCDIHFTSSLLAANHAEHMEMLINWKCTICSRIFKKEDELSHERQHSVSNNFLTYNLGDLDVTNILFRCSKCATHFTESNFLYHYRDCGLEVTKTVTCKICNILLDYNLKTLHEFDKHTESKPFTIIQCDVISDNPVKSTVSKSQTRDKLKELLKSFSEVKIVLQKMDSNKINRLTKPGTSEELPKVFQDNEASGKLWRTRLRKSNNTSQKYRLLHGLNKSRPNIADHSVLRRRNLTYSYCRNCKCFITKFKKAVHFRGSCRKLAKKACTCEHCGLILNKASIMTHRRLHMERKDLKLANFRFFNLFNGRCMNPPIPEYPKCTHCAVHFLTKSISDNHICSEVTYDTCHLCEIKFSPAAFKLHMTFHQYATNRIKRNTFIKGKFVSGENIINSAEKYTELTHTIKSKNLEEATTLQVATRVTHENVSDTSENERELPNNPLDVAETELTENLSQEYIMKDKKKLDAPLVKNKKRPVNVADHLALSRRNMIYSYCKTCKCFITKFKKSAHAQGRCKKMSKIACTCEHCGLILNDASIVTHRRLHKEMKDLKLKNFRFFNLYTGRTMNPPLPEYPKCGHCAVHFLTKPARNNHICSEVAYKTCNICEIKLSEAAFNIHVTFHQYASDRKKIVKTKNLQEATTSHVAKCVADGNVSDTTEKERELPNNPLYLAETELNGNISQEYKMKDKTKLDASLVENKKIPINVADHLPLSRRNMMYSYCKTCKCFITKFKKSAHAQGRCNKTAIIACTCEHCGLIFNDVSIVTHRRLHEEKIDLKLKNFRFFNLYTGRTMNPPIPEYPKCGHCAVHFLTKPARNNHICSEVASKTCNICEIKLSEAAFKYHVTFHQYASDRKKIVNTNNLAATTSHVAKCVADENVIDTTEKERELPNNTLDVAKTDLTANISREYKINDKAKLGASLVENKQRPVTISDHLAPRKRNMLYSYCTSCKCFITKFRKSAHAQGRCNKMAIIACTCEHCGLIFNDVSIVTHRRLHEEKKDLKLKNFKFFNLYTGRTMNPPLPEYPKCGHCAVHFLSKPARNNHICSEVAYKTCNICEIKLSEAAFNIHVTFHQYASDRKKIVKTKNLQAATTSHVAKCVADGNVSDTTEKERELPNKPLYLAETELTGNISQEYKMKDKTKLDASLVENKKIPINVADHLPLSRRNMIYSYCKTCKCFITKFRKSAHAQGRCKKMAIIACTCEHCGLIFNDVSIVTHRRLHEEKKDLKLKNFRFFNLYTGRTMNPPIPEYPKCGLCAVHFLTKPARNNHICSEVASKTCNICGIKLSEAAFKYHVTFHQYASDRKKIVKTNNLQAATTSHVAKCVADENVIDTTEKERELPNNTLDVAKTDLTANISREYKINDKAKLGASLVENKQRPVTISDHLAPRKRNMLYSYCTSCKCFITKFRKSAHAQGRCKKMAKNACTCEHCGLILNDVSIVTHRRLHEEKKDLKLKNFKFFNLYTGRTMNPPIPEYPNCSHCAVQFLTKPARNNHICSEVTYKTCNICEIKLSEAVFKLHMTFHQYPSDRKKIVKTKNLQAATTSHVAKCVADGNVSDTSENERELPNNNNSFDVAKTELTRNISREYKMNEKTKLGATFHQYATDRKMTITSKNLEVAKRVAHENVSDTTEDEQELPNNLLDVAEIKLTAIRTRRNISRKQVVNKKRLVSIADLRRRNLTYSYCETCKCFVTKFRKATHVQGRCKKLGKTACTCEYCGLILNSASIVTHRRLHIEKQDLKLKNFRFFNLYDDRSMNPPIPDYPKCDHCAVHFLNKKTIITHICSAEAHQTCHVCEIKLSEPTFKLHMTFHQYATDRINGVKSKNANSTTTLELEKCVTDGNLTTTENDNELKNNPPNLAEKRLTEINKCKNTSRQYKTYSGRKPDAFQAVNNKRQCTESYMETIHNPLNVAEMKQSEHISQEYKMNTKTKLDSSLDENKKRPVNIADHLDLRRRNMIYSYCETCKCFITKFRKDAHAQGRCKKLAKIACTCEYCGLILNDASIVTHRRLHEERKDLKLKNFWFFNLYTGRSMNPPVPEYPKCTRCAVHFLTEKARNNHICSQQAYQACHLCEIKLSQAAFKLHMNFHQYATDRINRVTPSSQSARTLDIEKRVINEGVSNSTENYIKPIRTPPDLAETKLTADTSQASTRNGKNEHDDLQVHVTSKNSQSARTLDIEKRVTNEAVSNSTENYIKPILTPPDLVETKLTADTSQASKRNGKNEHDDLQVHVTSKNSQSARTLDIENRVTNEAVSNSTENYINPIRTPPDSVETKLTADTSQASKMNGKKDKVDLQVHVTSKNSQSARTFDIENRVTNEDVSNSTENYINPIRTPPDSVETKLTADTSQESKMNDENEQDDLQVVNKKRHVKIIDHLALRRRNVTYSYCETCKCFVTKFSKATHVQGRCKILAKNACTCELCGLILSDASVATHRRLHEERKDIKLKHFRFFNLYTGRSMSPPIPQYPKCTQCAVQFLTKIARNNHICSEQSYQMCHLCESRLSEAAFKLHMKFHQYPTDRCKRITPATTSDNEKLLTCEDVTATENDTELKNNPPNLAETRLTAKRKFKNTSRQYETNGGRKLDAFQTINNKRLNVKYSFCETCKCFITNFKKDAHVQRRCKNMAKIACTCEQCGLVFNSASIVTHRRLHEKKTDLKLKNFRFFNLYTGRTTNPPIPEYPKCTHCAVHFLTKTASKDHVCGKDAYQTCHLCEIKLTEAAFLLHMTFHKYATERIKKVVLKNSKPTMTLDIEKPVTNENECKTTENETELVRYPLDEAETPVQNSSDVYEIVYTCGNCSVSVDTYDKVVEHSQRHYENEDQETQTKFCTYCELTIDAACYTNHQNLHEKEKELKLLKFDSYYLPADNNLWVKHIFKTLPKEKVLDILKSSIYRFDCRIKMDIIQQGDPNLTVYKCDECSCFIEPGSLFKHSDNSCFKLRHHPCTVCGIPFNSSASRIDHEKIHNCPGITTDSYRIVIFNRERDKQMNRSFCLRKNYVLFQCRKCGVIIDKVQGDIHTCDFSNVKKCPQCALLLNSKDFERHVNTHKEFVSFNYSNMKIVILGDDNTLKDQREITLRSNFKGAIYDYKMYICNKCETCVKNEMCMSNHICRYGKQRLKCLKCALYFSVGRLKTHTRSHEQDPDFVRSNMNLVSFDPCNLDQNKNTTAVCSKDCELSDSNTDSDTEILTADDTSITNVIETIGMIPEILEEETVKLYKCTCGLHFLNEDSIIRHFGVCRSTTTISKQKCSKCDLLFTPNVLFTHMLAHHSRNSCYKYNVIEIDRTEKNMVQ